MGFQELVTISSYKSSYLLQLLFLNQLLIILGTCMGMCVIIVIIEFVGVIFLLCFRLFIQIHIILCCDVGALGFRTWCVLLVVDLIS